MYVLNKIVWGVVNPVSLVLLAALGGGVLWAKGRKAGLAVLAFDALALWLFSTPAGVCLVGLPLERPYLALQSVESVQPAGAIVVLGGGIWKAGELAYPDMADAADRVWHAARLYRAGKSPRVVVSGCDDLESAVPLLLDFGVPRDAIAVDNESRNTYENSRFTARMLKGGEEGTAKAGGEALLVTSAWHMTRALGNFARSGLAVSPAPSDFKAHGVYYGTNGWWMWIVPSAENLYLSSVFAKEWIGRFARR